MADQNVNIAPIARQPSIFKMGMDFPTWFRQFVNYCVITNTPAAQRFGVMCSFLDSSAFTTVENLRLANDIRADITAAFEPLRIALHSPDSRIPARFAIRHRAQREEESLDEFVRELEKLARNAFPDDNNIRANQTLIDAFISGLRSDELSIKLLQRNFANVTEALNEAKEFLSARDTRKYLKRNSARNEILVNRALLQDSENEEIPTQSHLPFTPASTLSGQSPCTHHPLTENEHFVAQTNVTPEQQRERGQYHPTNPFVSTQQGPATWNTAQNGNTPRPQNGRAILTCYYCGGINHTQRFCMLYNRHFGIYSGNQSRRRNNYGNDNRGRSYDDGRDYRNYNNSNNRGGNSQRQNNNHQDFQNRDQDFQNRN